MAFDYSVVCLTCREEMHLGHFDDASGAWVFASGRGDRAGHAVLGSWIQQHAAGLMSRDHDVRILESGDVPDYCERVDVELELAPDDDADKLVEIVGGELRSVVPDLKPPPPGAVPTNLRKKCPRCSRVGRVWVGRRAFTVVWPGRPAHDPLGAHPSTVADGVTLEELLDDNFGCGYD